MAQQGEKGQKRARSDSSEQTVLDADSPGQVHASKKACVAMDAVEKQRVGATVERLGEEEGSVNEKGENAHGERCADRDNNGKDNDNCECIHDNVTMQLAVAQPLCAGGSSIKDATDDGPTHRDARQLVCAGKAFNEADPINEAKEISVPTGKDSKEATVGPRCFTSAMDMLDFFYCLLHGWPLNLNINKYEHIMLEDLLKKGHHEWHEKVGTGIKAFQVRINREFSSRCFHVIREDGSAEDFSYRKCVNRLMPLPELSKPRSFTSDQKEKGPNSLSSSKAQVPKRARHNVKGRGRMLDKDWGGGRGISRHTRGRGIHCVDVMSNGGGIRRGNDGRQGKGARCIRGARSASLSSLH